MLSSRGPESSSTVAIEKNDDFNDDFVPAKHVPHQKNDSNDMDEDDGCCPICLEPWTTTGPHVLVSVACGHLFGKSCIERWMKKKQGSAQPKCPQCNAPIKAATIRRIYLPGGKSSLRIMDTTERDELMGKIREEQRLRFQMEQQQQQLALRYKEEIEHWKRELEQRTAELSRLKQLGTPRGFSSTVSMPVQFLHSPSRSMGSVSGAAASQRLLFQFQDGVEISRDPGASRAMSFCRQSGVIAVSKSADWHSASGQFNCHGLLCTRIERTDVVEFIGKIHDKPVRDVQQSPRGDQLTLTTAWDKQLRISSTGQTRNGILQTFNLPAMGWSCSWHPDNPSLVVAGLSGNRMAVFDVRNATQPTQLINCPSASATGGLHLAVHSLSFSPRRGLICGNLEGIYCVPDISSPGATQSAYIIDQCQQGERLDSIAPPTTDCDMDLLLASYRRHATEPFLKCFQIPAPILSAEFVYEDRPVSGHRLPQLTGSDWRPLFNSCLPIQFKQTRIYQPCLLRLPSNGPSVDNNRKRLRFDDGSGGASQKSEELMLASYDEHQRSVLLWDCTETVGPTRLCQSIKCNAAPVMALHSLPVAGYSSPWLGVLTETQLLLYKS